MISMFMITFAADGVMSMLWGIVFFSHQLGSFLGGWGAGRLYDLREITM